MVRITALRSLPIKRGGDTGQLGATSSARRKGLREPGPQVTAASWSGCISCRAGVFREESMTWRCQREKRPVHSSRSGITGLVGKMARGWLHSGAAAGEAVPGDSRGLSTRGQGACSGRTLSLFGVLALKSWHSGLGDSIRHGDLAGGSRLGDS